jgi:hypothetical protein
MVSGWGRKSEQTTIFYLSLWKQEIEWLLFTSTKTEGWREDMSAQPWTIFWSVLYLDKFQDLFIHTTDEFFVHWIIFTLADFTKICSVVSGMNILVDRANLCSMCECYAVCVKATYKCKKLRSNIVRVGSEKVNNTATLICSKWRNCGFKRNSLMKWIWSESFHITP